MSGVVYRCDGCKVVESEWADPGATPVNWLRVQTCRLRHNKLPQIATRHYCPACTRLIESYLAGRRVEEVG
jgi:hypothetical protein